MNIEENLEQCQHLRTKFRQLNINGPWMNEPDRVQWTSNGLDCLIVRNHNLFSLCGYVGVKPGHPYFGLSSRHMKKVKCHGGVTFAGLCHGHICHVTDDNDKVWWVGFDFAHAHDFLPVGLVNGVTTNELLNWQTYRTIDEAKREAELVAKQLVDLHRSCKYLTV